MNGEMFRNNGVGVKGFFFGWSDGSILHEQKELIEMPDASRKVWRFGYSGLWPSKDL